MITFSGHSTIPLRHVNCSWRKRSQCPPTVSILTLALLTLGGLAVPLGAQEVTGAPASEEGVTLDFQDAELRVVISALAELAGVPVAYSDLPSRTVTLRSPTPVPRGELRGMLESLIRSNGLVMVEEGGLLRISAPGSEPTDAGFVGPAPEGGGGIRIFVYRLRHAKAEPMTQTLRELFGLGERVTAAASPNLQNPAVREARRQRLPVRLDEPTGSGGSLPETGESAGPPVNRGLSAQVTSDVQIIPDASTNSILVRASAEDYETVKAAIQQLDTRPLQVLIEVLIAEVSRDRRSALGVDISVPDQRDLESGVVIGGELTSTSAGDAVLRIMGIGAVRADVVLRALAASSDVTILSRPIVLAQNNHQARILVGSQRPFIQLFRSLPTDAAVRDQIVQYRDVGTQLTITPTINPDGYVTLEVFQEVSNATAETQFGAPIISNREAQTQLFIKDGHTAVLGGLIDNQRETANSGIPILKDIPILGNLFRSTQRRNTRTELFILLTPHILRLDEDVDAVTRELRESARLLDKRVKDPIPLIEREGLVKPRRQRQ